MNARKSGKSYLPRLLRRTSIAVPLLPQRHILRDRDAMHQSFVALFGRVAEGEGNNW